MHIAVPLTLDSIALGQVARVSAVDWAGMAPAEARRLREFGLDIGTEVEALHRGSLFSRDPLAIRLGTMRVVLRSTHASHFALVLVT